MILMVRKVTKLLLFVSAAVCLVACEEPTFQEQSVQCRKACGEKGKFGTMERRPAPQSPKPMGNQYDCVCS